MSYLKFVFKTFSFLIVFIILTKGVHAASIILSPSYISLHQGEKFSIRIGVATGDKKAYTVVSKTSFTPQILHFSGFEFNAAWIPLHQKTYELSDNTLGKIVRTAGYPQGFTGDGQFGVMTFQAEKEGMAVIMVSPDSLIYDDTNHNMYAGVHEIKVEVLPKIVKKENELQPQNSKNIVPVPTQPQDLPAETSSSQQPVRNVLPANELPPKELSPLKIEPGIPTLFDVSAEIGSQNYPNPTFFIALTIIIITLLLGTVFIILLGRLKKRPIIQPKRKKNGKLRKK